MILEANNLKYSYGNNNLIDNIDLVIDDHDKIGLIGLNGMGKSTLLKILSKEIEPEKGSINYIGKRKISFMHQEINLDEDLTINEYIDKFIDEDIAIHEAKSILTKLEIFDFDKKVKDLSGGTKRKIVLGTTLAKPCDLLILDEPTNHLDSDIIEFLEKYLIKFNKAILMVTHDRYFLERVVNKIIELDHGKIYSYVANYSKYLELKNERAEYEEARNRKLQAFLRREYEWIKRGPQARATKDKRRIENYNELTSQTKEKEKTLVLESGNTRLGNKTIEFINVSKEYDRLLFSNLSFNLNKNERIGIIGKNGSGKTTLLDTIRNSKIVDSESGGITQAIGAYQVEYNNELMTFIDTPGHAAFTEMRARGASVTDIVIIIVAADDGVMPQTKEAVDHALAAGVPIIVAVNKIDKPDAKPDKIMEEMAAIGITPEEWSGKYPFVKISAATGQGIDDLLATIIATAEMLELKANPNRYASGTVIESKMDKNSGVVTTILIQNGTLRLGDAIVVGNNAEIGRAHV